MAAPNVSPLKQAFPSTVSILWFTIGAGLQTSFWAGDSGSLGVTRFGRMIGTSFVISCFPLWTTMVMLVLEVPNAWPRM